MLNCSTALLTDEKTICCKICESKLWNLDPLDVWIWDISSAAVECQRSFDPSKQIKALRQRRCQEIGGGLQKLPLCIHEY